MRPACPYHREGLESRHVLDAFQDQPAPKPDAAPLGKTWPTASNNHHEERSARRDVANTPA